LIVSNMRVADPVRIVEGNQRVIRPRLADARFFFETDKKASLASRLPQLTSVVYHNKLGSQAERGARVQAIAERIAQHTAFAAQPAGFATRVKQAAQLAKADLLTLMVGEFPALQGIMGRYYAQHDGLPESVADAIADHYKPRFSGDALPRGQEGTVLALADKLETLVGLFGIGQVPTGDKDPFALRRHALGVLRLLRENHLALDLRTDLIAPCVASFAGLISDPTAALSDYFADRLGGVMRDEGFSPQHIDAVRAMNDGVVLRVPQRLAAVQAFSQLPESASLAAANKRVSNILKKVTEPLTGEVQTALLQVPAETNLAQAVAALEPKLQADLAAQRYSEYLASLATLASPVDAFFTEVMVNAEDPALRLNRLNILSRLHRALGQVADLSALAS
jgi:glycyl-tRNA synthetase beta chain